MALQPVVNPSTSMVFAYEALVRGPDGQGAPFILDQVTEHNRSEFDQSTRLHALELAARLGVADAGTTLSVNFLAGAIGNPQTWLRKTLEIAEQCRFPTSQIMFEVMETEQFGDYLHLKTVIGTLQQHGFRTAIDDFGSGFAGINMLSQIRPDYLKLDIALINGIGQNAAHQAIVRGMRSICTDLGIGLIAEGVETAQERETLESLGVDLLQGFLFARPGLEMLPRVTW